jgi:hypothetical protein
MYALTDQILIVAPKQTDIRTLLLKYSSLFGIVIAGTLAIVALSPLIFSRTANEAAPMMATRETSGAGLYAAKAMADTGIVQEVSPDLALAFFCGGAFVIFVLLCYEAYLWKKKR